jgi:hypothetical protein
MKFKTGIANRALKPTLGIVDTLNTDSCPTAVHISAGLDVVSIHYRSLGRDDTDSPRHSSSMLWKVTQQSHTQSERPDLRILC